MYMYTGMADIAALTGNPDYITAIDRLWENVVTKKMYLTGGVGAWHDRERFGDDYELPNRTAYNETCAAIGNIFWNYRLFLMQGDAQYLDVLERVLYNGFLWGVSMTGDRFFYPNPLESDGRYRFNKGSAERQPWFGVACCPGNVTRFMPSIPGYIYAVKDDALYINLFIANSAHVEINNTPVHIIQATRYPWEGNISIAVSPVSPAEFTIKIRVPGWVRNGPVPGDLYRYADDTQQQPVFAINGEKTTFPVEKEFAVIRRTWESGDRIEIEFPMPVRRVLCNENFEENQEKVALERGPLVYCAEGIDNEGNVLELIMPDNAMLQTEYRQDLLNGIQIISGTALKDGEPKDFIAVPYYAWNHRGAGEMAVWFLRKID